MSFSNVPIGKNYPKIINIVIEIPKGSRNKYEYDPSIDEIVLDRVIHTTAMYPTDYGFIPQTKSKDGDHLDALVLITDSLFPGCVVEAKPIGMLDMEDEKGVDWKIISVASKDPRLVNIKDIYDLDKNFKAEVINFFQVYKLLEGKKVKVNNWHNKERAYMLINKCKSRYDSLIEKV